MKVIIDPITGNVVSNGALSEEQVSLGLIEKEINDVDLGQSVWNNQTQDYVPVSSNVELDPIDFLQLFTIQERMAIRTAAKSDVIIEDFLATLPVISKVNLNHPLTIQALEYFVSLQLISSERYLEIRG